MSDASSRSAQRAAAIEALVSKCILCSRLNSGDMFQSNDDDTDVDDTQTLMTRTTGTDYSN